MNIKIASYGESERQIRAVRDAVFGREQKVPREIDWDGNDPRCVQVVATDDGGLPIGAGRMQPDGRIGRLAVLKRRRGQGVGRKMLEALIESARRQGFHQVHVHAQVQAIPFYEKSGFRKVGAEFLEAGIRHVHMTRSIRPAPRTQRSTGS
jgi:predicted GNAT family N-acyltransferase